MDKNNRYKNNSEGLGKLKADLDGYQGPQAEPTWNPGIQDPEDTPAEQVADVNDLIIDDEEDFDPDHFDPNDIEIDIDEISSSKEEQQEEEPAKDVVEKPARKQQRAIVEHVISTEAKSDRGEEITLPSDYDKNTIESVFQAANFGPNTDQKTREWRRDVQDGLYMSTINDAFVSTLEDETAEFRHKFEHAGTDLTAKIPRLKAPSKTDSLRGERGTIRLISHMGLGTIFQVPLYNSGIWVTFKPPSESEIIELDRLIAADKIRLGRSSYGLIYSNLTSYSTSRFFDFALAHVYEMSTKIEDINEDNLKEHIVTPDIGSFLWGFICTMYPSGFRYKRGCIFDPVSCNHVLEETLNISKLQWINTAGLTDWQKTHMSARQAKNKDLASITRYKEELGRIQKKRIVFNKDTDRELAIVLKTPTVQEHIDSGHRWISSIVDAVERTIGTGGSENEKNALMTKLAQASVMRQYAHWVDSIEFADNLIDDLETIEDALNQISSDVDSRVEFDKAISDYINTSTVSVIGIPVYECPKCGGRQGPALDENNPYRNIIPLDITHLFFVLLTQRVQIITAR